MHISELIELLFNSDAYIDHSFLLTLTKLRGLYNFGGMVQFSCRTSGQKKLPNINRRSHLLYKKILIAVAVAYSPLVSKPNNHE
jgi:hypothetical protein